MILQDTSGVAAHQLALMHAWTEQSDAFILAFDRSSHASFESMKNTWEVLRDHVHMPRFVIVGTSTSAGMSTVVANAVSKQRAMAFADGSGALGYFEVMLEDSASVTAPFAALVKALRQVPVRDTSCPSMWTTILNAAGFAATTKYPVTSFSASLYSIRHEN